MLTNPFTGSNRTAVVSLTVMVALLLTGIGCYGWGHSDGYEEAEAKGKADLSALRSSYADASANATATALHKLQAEADRANLIASELITTRADLSKARADINRRINHAAATADPACAFGPELVGLLNEAFYGLPADPLPEGPGPGGAAGGSGEAAPAGAGLRANASVVDLLTWQRDLGAYVRGLEATSASRRTLLMGGL